MRLARCYRLAMDASAPSTALPGSPDLRWLWWAYAGLLLTIALLLSFAALPHYIARGGRHPWEPFVWEFSSVFMVGWLGVAIYRWHRQVLRRAGLPRRIGLHLLGALVFVLLHVGGMFALRWAIYVWTQVAYEPGGALQVLAYESGRDLITYGTFVGFCHGLHLTLEAQRRQLELTRLRAELAQAQLTRLAEQIQPHFLFNTLNLISSVMYEDVPRADRILCQLADLLRQALAAQQAGWHSLAQELQLVEPFLAIMQARFGPRLQVHIEVSPQARECRLPALLLISPVENAIKHDVAARSSAVEVSVRAWVEGQTLHVVVCNSGATPQRTEREGALGLANLRARVLGHYGPAAEVSLQAGAAGGSVLSLRLPMESLA